MMPFNRKTKEGTFTYWTLHHPNTNVAQNNCYRRYFYVNISLCVYLNLRITSYRDKEVGQVRSNSA